MRSGTRVVRIWRVNSDFSFGLYDAWAVGFVIVVVLFGLLIQILIIRAGVRWGLRDHRLWLEKTRRVPVESADQRNLSSRGGWMF